MRTSPLFLIILIGLLLSKGVPCNSQVRGEGRPDPGDILEYATRVADWQLANPYPWPLADWVQGPFLNGMMALGKIPGQEKYISEVKHLGESIDYEVMETISHWVANDHCSLQAWLELYELKREEQMIAPTRDALDLYISAADTLDDDLAFKPKNGLKWSWCDALFMSPPTFARLAKITGEQKYLDYLHEWWWKVSDYYYDTEEHLYFRDETFFEKREANGEKIFWSRGNGWVLGGLVRVLEYLPADDPSRPRYEQQLGEMCQQLVEIRCADKLWRAGLLDTVAHTQAETSGSAFFVYGLAYAINQGIINREAYHSVIWDSYLALIEFVGEDGIFSGVQPVGDSPVNYDRKNSMPYGVGAFLLASTEMCELAFRQQGAEFSQPKCTGFNRKVRVLENPVFVFNNAFNTRATPYNEIADLLADLGYDGIEHRDVKGIFELKKELDSKGLRIFTDYTAIDIDKDPPYLEEWKEVIPRLEGSGLILWVHIHSERFEPSDPAADEIVVPILQELADFAAPYGVRIATYPHRDFLVETAGDSYRIARKANRENVGAVFNLVHFLLADEEDRLEELIEKVTPYLFAVSLSGAERGDYGSMHMNQVIQPIGEGNYDVYRVLELLLDHGYKGPVGFQCFMIPGEPSDFLKTSMETWKEFKSIYGSGANRLSSEEMDEGWKLLFDGHSSFGWRGITKNSFPSDGWEVISGEIRISALDGAESGNGGDVITLEEYGPDFELTWEWKMLTRGGNSGVKYFVKEGLTTNSSYGYGLEYQILDDMFHPWMIEGKMEPNDYHTAGALYEFFAPSEDKEVRPLGEWNTSRIISKDMHVEHWLNGKKILEYERAGRKFNRMLKKSKFMDVENFGAEHNGHILLQDHGSKVHYRNIKIREL